MKDKFTIPNNGVDEAEPFQYFPPMEKENIQFKVITPQSYDGRKGDILNIDDIHTGEEIAESAGMYKTMTLEEAEEKGYLSEEDMLKLIDKHYGKY